MKERLKLSHALFWIFFSTFIVSGFNFFIFYQAKKYQKDKLINKKFDIQYIGQVEKPSKLPVDYLADCMGLFQDRPTNFFLFDEKKAQQNLLKSPFIKEAKVEKINPNLVFVDYTLRLPIAKLYDFEDIAIDEEGFLLPLKPFFKGDNLCYIYLDLERFYNYEKVDNEQMVLALKILKALKQAGCIDSTNIQMIDTSRIGALSYGKKEIILSIEEKLLINKNQRQISLSFPHVLRLAQHNFLQQLSNYISLRKTLLKDYENQLKNSEFSSDLVTFATKTIDLRISKLAFIDK